VGPNERPTIHCIGDSHVSFFSGEDVIQPLWPGRSDDRLPYFKTFRVGAALAYNLCETGTRMRGREVLFSILRSEVPSGSTVLVCFGEIDCRAHLLRQAESQQRELDEVVDECVRRYFSVIKEVMAMGYSAVVWNAIPSTLRDSLRSPEFPVYGSCLERNRATRLFNDKLRKLCEEQGANFLSIFDRLVDKRGLTRMAFYMDTVHLSQRAMPLVAAALRKSLGFSNIRLPFRHRCALTGKSLARLLTPLRRTVGLLRRVLRRLLGRHPRQTAIGRTPAPLFDLGFHGDRHLLAAVDKIAEHVTGFVETGSNVGSTARYMAKTYPEINVYSCEPDSDAFKAASENVSAYPNARIYNMNSPDFLHRVHAVEPSLVRSLNLYYLDAHGYGYQLPLRAETEFITGTLERGVVIVDDFKVPDMPQFAYGSYDGGECSYEHLLPSLRPGRRYHFFYPSYTEHTSPHHRLTGYVIVVFGEPLVVDVLRPLETLRCVEVDPTREKGAR